MDEWWKNKETEIGELLNEEYGVEILHGQKKDDEWEYVAIYWNHGIPQVSWTLKNGALTK